MHDDVLATTKDSKEEKNQSRTENRQPTTDFSHFGTAENFFFDITGPHPHDPLS